MITTTTTTTAGPTSDAVTTPILQATAGIPTPQAAPVAAAPARLAVTVPQALLKRALKLVGHAAQDKSALPILNHVLLQADSNRGLKLQATNLEVGVTVWLSQGVTVTSVGATTLAAKLLTDVVSALPDEVLTLTSDPEREATTITSTRFTTSIHGIAADEFPPIPNGAHLPRTVTIDAAILRQVIAQVALAAATDDTRPTLTGVLLTLHGAMATLAAADGFRLARKTLTLTEAVTEPVAVIVPARALIKLAALLAEVRGEVEVTVKPGSSQIVFATSELEVVTRLLDGTFPDIARVIPTQHTTAVDVETAELARAVKLASFVAASSSHIVRLRVTPGDPGQLTVAATATEVGDNTGQIAATLSGEATEIALNAQFLREALHAVGAQTVRLELRGGRSPALLRPIGDDSYLHLIMPMTVR